MVNISFTGYIKLYVCFELNNTSKEKKNGFHEKHLNASTVCQNNPKFIAQMEIKIYYFKIWSVTAEGLTIPYVGYLCLVIFHPPTYGWTISLSIFCGMESRAW